ncbi:MAG: TIGR01777 family oxidoreductase [Bacteroidia bacterium]
MTKNIAILGGTGLIGKHLTKSFEKQKLNTFVLTRGESKTINVFTEHVHYNPYSNQWPTEELSKCDVVINLAGKSIGDNRLTTSVKSEVYKSRVQVTKSLVTFLNNTNNKCNLLINGSAIGYYGYDRKDEMLEEDADPGIGFFAELCDAWEKEAKEFDNGRLAILRTGIVLDREEGAFKKLKTPILLSLGSALASGKQWMPWIHINDMVGIINYIILNNSIEGVVNAVGPKPVRNKRLIGSLADSLNKAILLPKVPGFVLKLMLGEFANSIIGGLRVMPKKLQDNNFIWEYYDIDDAMKNLNWNK